MGIGFDVGFDFVRCFVDNFEIRHHFRTNSDRFVQAAPWVPKEALKVVAAMNSMVIFDGNEV